jgi:alpha-L-rhamnosidase
MWEHWEKEEAVYSHNHPMFGSVSEWFYKSLAGINPAPGSVAFDKIVIRPQIVGDLKWAYGSYNSIRGRIETRWQKDGDTLWLEVLIPANTTAEIWIPSAAAITESGKPAELAEGVQTIQHPTRPDGPTVITVGSGSYTFQTKLPKM